MTSRSLEKKAEAQHPIGMGHIVSHRVDVVVATVLTSRDQFRDQPADDRRS